MVFCGDGTNQIIRNVIAADELWASKQIRHGEIIKIDDEFEDATTKQKSIANKTLYEASRLPGTADEPMRNIFRELGIAS